MPSMRTGTFGLSSAVTLYGAFAAPAAPHSRAASVMVQINFFMVFSSLYKLLG